MFIQHLQQMHTSLAPSVPALIPTVTCGKNLTPLIALPLPEIPLSALRLLLDCSVYSNIYRRKSDNPDSSDI